MSKAIHVLFSVLTAACGRGDVENMGFVSRKEAPVATVMPSMPEGHDDIKIITHQFYATAYAYRSPICDRLESISFADDLGKDIIGREIVGVCRTWLYENGEIQKRQIVLKTSWWDEATDVSRQTLLYHELAHCVLGLSHEANYSGEIMQPTILSDEIAQGNWFTLVANLFKTN